jgi:O-antigen ligase
MGPIVTYIVFGISTIFSPLYPLLGVMGYAWFIAITPTFLWKSSLFNYQFQFQKYIVGGTLLGFLISGLQGLSLSKSSKRSICGLLVYWGLSAVSTLNSVEPSRSWFFLEHISKVFLMILVIIKVADSGARLSILMWIILGGVGWNCIEINRDYYSRGFSLVNEDGWAFMNANGYALIVVMVSVICFALFLAAGKWSYRLLYLLLCLVCVHAIFIMQSRGAMLGLIAGGSVVFFLVKKNPKILISCLLGLICVFALAGPSVVDEFSSAFKESDELDASASSRFLMWRGGVALTLDYPLLGVGPWAAEIPMATIYAKDVHYAERRGRVALHNLPLEVSTGSGIPAFVGYVVFFFLPCYSLWKQRRITLGEHYEGLRIGFIGAITGYWFSSLFNSGALMEMPYLIAAASISLNSLVENQLLSDHERSPDTGDSEAEFDEGFDVEDSPKEVQLSLG